VRRSQLTEIEEFTPRNADGREPGELIRKPPRSPPGRRGPITSVSSGKSGSDLLAQQCLSLIMTADDIYAVQGGAATLIASGVGGSLAAAESLTLDCG
jgi:hypothetical protein